MRTVCAIIALAFFVTVTAHSSGAQRNAVEMSSLPSAAQSSISLALGRDSASYHAHQVGGRLQAENAKQGLIEDFTSQNVEIRRGDSHLKLALQGYGYGASIKAARRALPVANRNRVEYRRGGLTEWYENGPLGLEQGFTIQERPGKANDRLLTVVLAVSGDLNAGDVDQEGLDFAGYDGKPVLRYSALSAYDATGRELRAREELRNGRLLLTVDDAEARYPVVIDPWIQVAKLTASVSEQAAELGYSVAVSGNTIVVGAPFDTVGANFAQGSVYVFVKPSTGWANMTETARLTASDGSSGDVLGEAVAISGNTIVAGAAGINVGSTPLQGAAYVFVEPSSGWTNSTETAKLTASDGGPDDFFAASVSIAGNTIAIGADGATVGSNPYQGAVYLFVEPSGGWTTTSTFAAKISTSDGQSGDQFGYSIALNSGTLAVGARSATVGLNPIQGAVYVFSEPATGWATTSTFDGKLGNADGAAGYLFGSSVSISSDNTVAAGAPSAAINANGQQGAVYVFVKPASGWANATQTAELTALGGQSNDQMGFNVAISQNGTNIVAGAPGNSSGAVYLYSKPRTGWADEKQVTKLTAADGKVGTWLGFGVAVSSGNMIGGAPCTTVGLDGLRAPLLYGPNQCQGAIYIFSK